MFHKKLIVVEEWLVLPLPTVRVKLDKLRKEVVILLPKVIFGLKAEAFRSCFTYFKKRVQNCLASNFGRNFSGNPIFCQKNCGGSAKISFKIAKRYLPNRDGHLSFVRKTRPKAQLRTLTTVNSL